MCQNQKKIGSKALDGFALEHPAFAGYDFSSDRKELIFYIADKHKGQKIAFDSEEKQGREIGHMRKEFLELIERSTGFPAASDAKGVTITAKIVTSKSRMF